MQHKKARNSSLTRNPHKYPRIPKTGTAKSTKARRIPIATMFCKNVVPVFPRPFCMLPMVVARYIKGHSQHKTVIKDPESSLRKIIVPRFFPNLVKIPMHKIPIYQLHLKDKAAMVEMRPCSFIAWALAADGSKRTAMELVIADGNRINGSAILVSTPYTDNASLLVRP